MTIKVAINGFGRIGRNVVRAALASKHDIEFVALVRADVDLAHRCRRAAQRLCHQTVDERSRDRDSGGGSRPGDVAKARGLQGGQKLRNVRVHQCTTIASG